MQAASPPTIDLTAREAIARVYAHVSWVTLTGEQRGDLLHGVARCIAAAESIGYRLVSSEPAPTRPVVAALDPRAFTAATADPALSAAVAEADCATGVFLHAVLGARPPLHQAVPVLAVARAAAALALLFGEPAVIDFVAVGARRFLRDGSLTLDSIFPGEDAA